MKKIKLIFKIWIKVKKKKEKKNNNNNKNINCRSSSVMVIVDSDNVSNQMYTNDRHDSEKIIITIKIIKESQR